MRKTKRSPSFFYFPFSGTCVRLALIYAMIEVVYIAHNVDIGRHPALTAGTIIGGSTRIGDMCWTDEFNYKT